MIRNIQALRALAVYLVFLEHSLQTLALGGFSAARLNFGHAGVDIFFVISGFIMVITTDTRETQPLDFLRHRIIRIVPIYWLITFAVFAVALVAPQLVQATEPTLAKLIKSLFFIPFTKANGLVQPVVFVGWTLNYEMFFYLLFTFSLCIRQRTARLAAMLAILIALTVTGAVFPIKANVVYTFFTDPIMLEFGAGVLLGAFWGRMPSLNHWIPLMWCGILIGCFFIPLRPSYWPEVHRAASFGLPAFLIVGSALFLEKAGKVVNSAWILLLGNASYSIYLTHFFVTQAASKAATRLHVHTAVAAICFVLLSAGLIAAVGILSHWYVEKPLTNLFKKRRPNPAGAPVLT